MEWKVIADVAQSASPALGIFLVYLWTEVRNLKTKMADQQQIIALVDRLDKRLVVLETILDEMRRSRHE